MLFSFKIFGYFPDIFLLWVPNLIPLWLENTLFLTAIFFLMYCNLFSSLEHFGKCSLCTWTEWVLGCGAFYKVKQVKLVESAQVYCVFVAFLCACFWICAGVFKLLSTLWLCLFIITILSMFLHVFEATLLGS